MIRKGFRYYLKIIRNALFFIIILFLLFIYQGTKIHNEQMVADIPRSAWKYIIPQTKISLHSVNYSEIRGYINEYNLQERILNEDIYGPVSRDSVILVVHVHHRLNYLKFLIMSLSELKGIQEVLLVFSHSYFDENINNLIQSVDFCRVLQIFYPYSVQAYPVTFPGYQNNDCPHNMDIKTAEALNCTGAYYPDIHGRYRHPVQSEQKHHWWWTANKVFENLKCTEDHEGIVIFLEENVYFMRDFLYMALVMKRASASFEQCEFLSLGTHTMLNYDIKDFYRVGVTTWDPTYHSDVLAFDITVWNTIVTHYDVFCRIDDYSWSRSLFYLSLNRKDGKRYKVMSSLVPRAFKMASCGLYENLLPFDFMKSVYEVLELQIRIKRNLFPPHIEVFTDIELENDEYIIFDYVESNGGWSDPRDKELCNNMTVSKIKKVILDMKNEFDDYNYGKD